MCLRVLCSFDLLQWRIFPQISYLISGDKNEQKLVECLNVHLVLCSTCVILLFLLLSLVSSFSQLIHGICTFFLIALMCTMGIMLLQAYVDFFSQGLAVEVKSKGIFVQV